MKNYLTILAFVFSFYTPVYAYDTLYTDPQRYSNLDYSSVNVDFFFRCDSDPSAFESGAVQWEIHIFDPNGTEFDGFSCFPGDIQTYSASLGSVGQSIEGKYNALALPNNFTCNGYDACSLTYPGTASTYFWYYESDNSLWGSNNGFFGTISTPENVANITSGVQQTGSKMWPMLVLLGVSVAFLIGLALINFINQGIKPERPKKTVINPNGEDFIEHGIDDLNFKREYGSRKQL